VKGDQRGNQGKFRSVRPRPAGWRGLQPAHAGGDGVSRRAVAFTQAEMAAATKASLAANMRPAFELRADGTRRIEFLPMLGGDSADGGGIGAAIEAARW